VPVGAPETEGAELSREAVLDNELKTDVLVSRLAEFVPGAVPVRVPVKVAVNGNEAMTETALIEYGTPQEVLFASSLALEFADYVSLENSDGSFKAEARIVAVHSHDGQLAVAARFTRNIANWIIKS